MPIIATRAERRMQGGAQAHLLAGDDGRWYVTKFRENPQHRRILTNEWIAASLLGHLRLATPEVRVVELTDNFLSASPEVYLGLGTRRLSVSPGWHFGSQFPGNPHTEAVYDYLPDQLLKNVANLSDFVGTLAFDKWTANSDSRQAVFFRRRIKEWLPGAEVSPQRKGFVAQMVDNGYILGGPTWAFSDAPSQGMYFQPLVYEEIRSLGDFEPWISQIEAFPEEAIDKACRSLPRPWIEGEEAELERLLDQLLRRRRQVRELILSTVKARPQMFRHWGLSCTRVGSVSCD